MEKIAVFFTGGTIGMRHGDDGAIRPALGIGDLLADLPLSEQVLFNESFTKRSSGSNDKSLSSFVEDHVLAIHWANLPSPHMTPTLMLALAHDLREVLEQDEVIGAVVTHGTDVLEETAFMLDLVLGVEKPVVVTGAMRAYDEPGYDGLRNLSSSMRICLASLPWKIGVVAQMADMFFAAKEVVKKHSMAVEAFCAPPLGPIGSCVASQVQVYRTPLPHIQLCPVALEQAVELVTLAPGMDGRFIACARETGAKGIVVEGFGAGNVPPSVLEEIALTIERGIPVVLTSRCMEGGVWSAYGYSGGATHLQDLGVILGGSLRGSKARILLMLALSLAQFGALAESCTGNEECFEALLRSDARLAMLPRQDAQALFKLVAPGSSEFSGSLTEAARLVFSYFV